MKKVLVCMMVSILLMQITLSVCVFAEDTKIEMKNDKAYIVLGPEGFTTVGAWTIQEDDTKHTILMGGKNGNASPNNPAKIQVCLPKDGSYKIYTYAKDYTTNPGVRFFEVRLGDYKFKTGNHGMQGYFWQESDVITTFGGDYTVEIADTSGAYARCAAVVITDDLEFNPSNDRIAVENMIKENQYKVGRYTYSTSDLSGRPDSEIAVRLNEQWLSFDVEPVLMNDRTMVPFRAIFETLGCSVSWDDETQTAIGKRNGNVIRLPIGSDIVTVSGKGVKLDQPATLKDGRTLVPLRFVSEALGAQVKWDDATKTVTIIADIPKEMVLLEWESFSELGTWIFEMQASGTFKKRAIRGTSPKGAGATFEDASPGNTKPAIASFDIAEAGTYRVWVHSNDYKENSQGTRFFQLAFNDQPMMAHKYGTHGNTGYFWASGGTVELESGTNTVYVHDTSAYYARFDAILLCKDLEYVPADNYNTLSQLVLTYDNAPYVDRAFPNYAREEGVVLDENSIENEHTKVVFYKVQTSKGQVVQNEIYAKHQNEWVKTKSRSEDLGYMVLQADEASYTVNEDKYEAKVKYRAEEKTFNGTFGNPYYMGLPHYFVPVDYVASSEEVALLCENKVGTLRATWSLDEENYPLVSIDFTPATDGVYSVAAWEGDSLMWDDFEYALAPFRVQYKRINDTPSLYSEMFLFTPMGTYTLYKNNRYSSLPVTKGVVIDPSWIPQRWTYKDNALFGISMHSADELYRGTAFAPVIGSDESKMQAGNTFNMRVRIVSDVADWFDNYENTVTALFDVTDYRKNYMNSLNDAIFNVRNLMLDDKYSGWDSEDMAHYNMEGVNMTSTANSMQALQVYLLSEDDDMLEKRAIPTLASALTRGDIHFNRTEVSRDGAKEPDAIGNPIAGFNANVMGGIYEMTRGTVPYLHQYTLEKGKKSITNSYGSIAPFVNDLALYKYTGDKAYLDKAIQRADEYLEKNVYAESTTIPAWASFIYIAYFPNLASLLDIYEVTGDQKYLDAADYVAKWMTTALWVPGIDGEKKYAPLMVNDTEHVTSHRHYSSETHKDYWWAGDKQMRIGRENLADTTHNNHIITSKMREVEGWIPSRVGLGVEQAWTYGNGGNIVMQCFVGDFMRLSAYTGEDFYATIARNAIIGRFRSYDGYYRNVFITYPQETNYPIDGPDYTGIYWHHIPPYLAMLEDFIINQTFAWSGMNISFPSLRQQGYAYFNSNQYGHEPGKFYDETEMWPWLAENTVHPDSIQIDWMAARKDGVAGIAFMNEDDVATTTTISLGDQFGKDKNYTGTATLYDKSGKIGTIDVVDGKFTLTIPAKSLQAIKLNVASVKAPSYAKTGLNPSEIPEIGATVSDHKTGKGYTLQLSADCYFAYVYSTEKNDTVKGATLTYSINGKENKLTDNVYPYEFIVRVDDVNTEFNYTLTLHRNDGTDMSSGSGVLMTKSLSDAKGIKYTPVAIAYFDRSKYPVTDEAKALKFKPTKLTLVSQGSGGSAFRFVFSDSTLPFKADENNVKGLVVQAELKIKDGATNYFEGVVTGYEDRDDMCILVVNGNIDANLYRGTFDNDSYSWENIMIYPVE